MASYGDCAGIEGILGHFTWLKLVKYLGAGLNFHELELTFLAQLGSMPCASQI